MKRYNPNIHHRKSIRLKGYDYSREGLYFITICTHNRECLFGEIVDGNMILNEAGKIADACWQDIPNHFPNAVLHEYIVMPNHVHGIIELVDGGGGGGGGDVGGGGDGGVVGAENFLPLPSTAPPSTAPTPPPSTPPPFIPIPPKNEFQKMIPRSIGSIVKGFKIGVTKGVRENSDDDNQDLKISSLTTIWQRNYYEIIIRDKRAYLMISGYILNNPKNWRGDRFYRKGK